MLRNSAATETAEQPNKLGAVLMRTQIVGYFQTSHFTFIANYLLGVVLDEAKFAFSALH